MALLCFTSAMGCEERIVRDSRFSTFAKRFSTQEKPQALQSQAPVAPVKIDEVLQKYDLTQFTGQPLYSLQIGFWDETFTRGDFRKAAAEYVLDLRRKGVEAYLFHGRIRSLVTVNLFKDGDLIPQPDGTTLYGPRVLELQKQFPYNLSNGEPFKLAIFGKEQEHPQPSFLIHMPRADQVAVPATP